MWMSGRFESHASTVAASRSGNTSMMLSTGTELSLIVGF
jgi:hypothetical protein